MTKNILDDDFEWDNMDEDLVVGNDSEVRQAVVMLRTFNNEDQAHLVAATLRSEGIDAHVVSATTGQLTPFDYSNVRLFVSQSQREMAENVLNTMNAQEEVYNEPQVASGRILMILVIGIFAIGLVIRLMQVLFGFFK
jgi:hypothetical protein